VRGAVLKTTVLAIATFLIILVGTSNAVTVDSQSSGSGWEVVSISTRPGIKVAYLLGRPASSDDKVIFLIFNGGDGSAPFETLEHGKINLSVNFLTRSAPLFIKSGASVAIVAPPSDRTHGMGCGFRSSDEHLQDGKKVIESLIERGFKEIFLAGHSNGTLSAVWAGSKIGDEHIKGVVLASAVGGVGGRFTDACYVGFHISKVGYPVLMVHHKDDACGVTPFADAIKLKNNITTKATLVEVRGGSNPKGDTCRNGHYHGFIGMEEEVVNVILDWSRGKEVPGLVGK
jgi:hypothetical protein